MTANILKLGSALALLAFLGAAARAQGQSDAAPERAPDEQRHDDQAASATVGPALLARLEQLEIERRKNRARALTDPQAWAEGRARRAAQHRQEIAQLWGSVVNGIDGQAKLRMHAERMSRLNRMLDLAQHSADKALIARVSTDIERELARHAKAMQATIATWGAR